MGIDEVAIAFAKWLEAHKAHVEAERRLAIASRTAWKFGGQPPLELVNEVEQLKEEADRLLAAAEAAMKRK